MARENAHEGQQTYDDQLLAHCFAPKSTKEEANQSKVSNEQDMPSIVAQLHAEQ